jgi:hypothetical protein
MSGALSDERTGLSFSRVTVRSSKFLPSNERGAEHRKHNSSTAAHVNFRANMFTEPLPSN